jgi:anti-sigma regulatory factor (Ser/Thr protein kinase)
MAKDLVAATVRCDEAAPAVVREAISHLDGVERTVMEDVKLVASELVTNAVRHSSCASDEFLNVRVTGDGWWRISVFDPGRSRGIAEITNRPPAVGGMGLKVVDKLASTWGAARRAHGYEVWAVLEAET